MPTLVAKLIKLVTRLLLCFCSLAVGWFTGCQETKMRLLIVWVG